MSQLAIFSSSVLGRKGFGSSRRDFFDVLAHRRSQRGLEVVPDGRGRQISAAGRPHLPGPGGPDRNRSKSQQLGSQSLLRSSSHQKLHGKTLAQFLRVQRSVELQTQILALLYDMQ